MDRMGGTTNGVEGGQGSVTCDIKGSSDKWTTLRDASALVSDKYKG